MELNPQQKEAVQHQGSPLLIVAGAGSGKTRTLTARLAHLLKEGVAPEHIVAITFTNKAAKEMRERISNFQLSISNFQLPYVGTFHSFGAKILREQAHNLGRTPYYTIFDTDDSLASIKSAMETVGLSKDRHPPAALLGSISKIKSELLEPADVLDPSEVEFFSAYEKFLERNNAFDFDDLIEKVVALFAKYPEMLRNYQARYTHILVDEYQDVNTAQYRFVKFLAQAHRNLSVVGDDAQAIYGWRSADYRNFLNFEKDWTDARVVFLDQNYRSSGAIIGAASALIAHNKLQKPKRLWTENETGDLLHVIKANDPDEEAGWIAEAIRNSVISNSVIKKNAITQLPTRPNGQSSGRITNYPITTTAILYRTNAQSRAIEQMLIVYNIPYHIFGGLKFYERKEIKDIVAGLRIAANPRDEVSRERLMKTLPVATARRLIVGLAEKGASHTAPELISYFLHEGDYFGYLAKKFKNVPERKENIEELIAFAGTFTSLHEFLERVSLLQSADEPRNQAPNYQLPITQLQSPINLMTIHLAKGLEFDRVYIIGASEGLLPHHRSYASMEELEEERRLMYVAMTRARKNLTVSFTHIPSRFLHEIPGDLTLFTDLTGRSKHLPDEDEMYLE